MAVVNIPESTNLRLMVQTGTDANGEPVLRARTYSRIKTSALDQDVYDAAAAIASLQVHPLNAVQRVDEGNLVLQA